MDASKIADMVRKLVALAGNNPSQEEAALAFAKAQELATRAGLDLDDLLAARNEESSPPREVVAAVEREIEQWDRAVPWKMTIAQAVAHANGCRIYYRSGNGGGIVTYGQPSDVETTHTIYLAIVRQVEPMATRAVAAYKARADLDQRFDESPRVYGTSWRLGCAATISSRLPSREMVLSKARAEVEAARREALALGASQEAACTALARVSRAAEQVVKVEQENERKGKSLGLRSGGGFSSGSRSSSGWADGARAGRGVSLGGGKAIRGAA